MDLYRVFPWDTSAKEDKPGGVFYVARQKQGAGRHDVPHLDGVLYCSLTAQSAVAEFIQFYRGRTIGAAHLQRPDQRIIALARFECDPRATPIDLDDPEVLVRFKIRPSQIMTHERSITQRMAEKLYASGASGLLWPSALESSWINASLFTNRTRRSLRLVDPISPIHMDMPDFLDAAAFLNIAIAS